MTRKSQKLKCIIALQVESDLNAPGVGRRATGYLLSIYQPKRLPPPSLLCILDYKPSL